MRRCKLKPSELQGQAVGVRELRAQHGSAVGSRLRHLNDQIAHNLVFEETPFHDD